MAMLQLDLLGSGGVEVWRQTRTSRVPRRRWRRVAQPRALDPRLMCTLRLSETPFALSIPVCSTVTKRNMKGPASDGSYPTSGGARQERKKKIKPFTGVARPGTQLRGADWERLLLPPADSTARASYVLSPIAFELPAFELRPLRPAPPLQRLHLLPLVLPAIGLGTGLLSCTGCKYSAMISHL